MVERVDGGGHWIREFIARDGSPFNYAGYYERLLDMSDHPESFPINVPHSCCDPVRDPVRELNEAFESGGISAVRLIQAKILGAINQMEQRSK